MRRAMRRAMWVMGIFGVMAALVGVVLLRPVQAHNRGTTRPAAPTTPAASTLSGCTLSPWSVATTPNTPGGVLRATAAISHSDVWAVGYTYNTATQGNQTLIEHWNGSAWNIVPSPNVGIGANQLYGVAAVSASDVWAVGYYDSSQSVALTLAMHWDGTQWSIVPSPNPGGSGANGYLAAVSAISANDVWTVGFYLDTTAHNDRTITEHWDGTQWSIVPSANPGTYPNDLTSVAAISANDIWAVGFYYDVNPNLPVGALMEHWDGTSWTAVANPPVAILYAVSAGATNDVWAVGEDGYNHAFSVHWNGTQWSVVPNPGPSQSQLSAISVVSSTDVWAAGGQTNSGTAMLTEHWNGSQWSVVPITSASGLSGLAAISSDDVWAVGTGAAGVVAEHYSTLAQGAPTSSSARRIGVQSPSDAIACQ